MIDFKKPIEIFRVNADATFELGKGVDPLVALGELSKAFMKQQDRIKRLEEALDLVIPNCSWVHHSKKHQHKCGEPCPVVALIEKSKEAKL